MFNVTGSEIVVILLLGLIVLGPERLPDAMRRVGKAWGELRRMSSSFQDEVRQGFEEPVKELKKTSAVMKDAASFANAPVKSVSKQVKRAVTGTGRPAATTTAKDEPETPVVETPAAEPGTPVVEPSAAESGTPVVEPSAAEPETQVVETIAAEPETPAATETDLDPATDVTAGEEHAER